MPPSAYTAAIARFTAALSVSGPAGTVTLTPVVEGDQAEVVGRVEPVDQRDERRTRALDPVAAHRAAAVEHDLQRPGRAYGVGSGGGAGGAVSSTSTETSSSVSTATTSTSRCAVMCMGLSSRPAACDLHCEHTRQTQVHTGPACCGGEAT